MDGLSWLQVGSKPGLETVHGLSCHYFLGLAVPFRYGPGEECNMAVLCPAVGDVEAVCVLFFMWLALFSVGCGRYSESMVTRRW